MMKEKVKLIIGNGIFVAWIGLNIWTHYKLHTVKTNGIFSLRK